MHELTVENLTFTYSDADHNVLTDLSFTCHAGHPVWVSGCNGSGKTTLFEVIAGLRSPAAGSIVVDGGPVERADVAYLPAVAPLYDELDCAEHVSAFCELWELQDPARSAYLRRVASLLDAFDLPFHRKLVAEFSSGMREKLGFALIASLETPVLLLDEPFTAMDEESRRTAVSWLTQDTEERVLLFTSHLPVVVESLGPARVDLTGTVAAQPHQEWQLG